MLYRSILRIKNLTELPQTYWIEPWAHDFTLSSNDLMEVVVLSNSEAPVFDINHSTEGLQIYIDNADSFDVKCNGASVELGYGREILNTPKH